MTLDPGTRLGHFEIVAPLGAGGMGEVYRARDTRLDRTVAIKVLPAHLADTPDARQRFEREARSISALNHPRICALYDVGHQDGIEFLVMEYVEGETLATRLERGPMPLAQVLKCGGEIAEALDKAHRSGVVHRDLKPGNVMLTTSGAKLLDFGLAKAMAPATSGLALAATVTRATPVTEQGTIVGTFHYMSPEQVAGRDVDGRSDIFSLGAVLCEMVTGRLAFPGRTQLSVAHAVLEKDPEPLDALRASTPPALDRAIRMCLAKDAEDRWQAARDLQLELQVDCRRRPAAHVGADRGGGPSRRPLAGRPALGRRGRPPRGRHRPRRLEPEAGASAATHHPHRHCAAARAAPGGTRTAQRRPLAGWQPARLRGRRGRNTAALLAGPGQPGGETAPRHRTGHQPLLLDRRPMGGVLRRNHAEEGAGERRAGTDPRRGLGPGRGQLERAGRDRLCPLDGLGPPAGAGRGWRRRSR